MSRRICVELHDALVKLRPKWFHGELHKLYAGNVKEAAVIGLNVAFLLAMTGTMVMNGGLANYALCGTALLSWFVLGRLK